MQTFEEDIYCSDFLSSDRLGELERDKVRLTEQLVAQQREHLAKEIDYYKKSKSKNLLKKGFKKLKGKIQVSRRRSRKQMVEFEFVQNL